MALNNYANLKTAVANWMGRSDLDSPYSAIDDGIAMFEAGVNLSVRHRKMITLMTTVTVTTGLITHPTDFLEWFQLANLTSPRNIEISTDDVLTYVQEKSLSGNPRYAVMRNTTTELYPAPADIVAGVPAANNLELYYYAAVPGLNAGNATNWLLTGYPSAYLTGVLMAMSAYTRDLPTLQQVTQLNQSVMASLANESSSTRFGGGALTMKAIK